jgi:hypothetical protein
MAVVRYKVGCPDVLERVQNGFLTNQTQPVRGRAMSVSIPALIDQYIREPEIDLIYDPFREINAGADPHLPDYVVAEQSILDALWVNQHTIIFAPRGAGKTSLRARLARDCRARRDGRQILGIVFPAPDPVDVGLPADRARFLDQLLRAGAEALLLEIAYRPSLFLPLPVKIQNKIRVALEENLAVRLPFVLEQLAHSGNLDPLIALVDATATCLPARPSAVSIRAFCVALSAIKGGSLGLRAPDARWDDFVQLVIDDLGYEALYVLLDAVDSYPTTADSPENGLALVAQLLVENKLWKNRQIFVKAFLPESYESELARRGSALLTEGADSVRIFWHKAGLVQVLRQRLLAASQGAKGSFNALSTPGLRDAEVEIVDHLGDAGRLLPRDAVLIAERVLAEHVSEHGAQDGLEPEDLDRALDWYDIDVRSKPQSSLIRRP